jgi:hypothetical protein
MRLSIRRSGSLDCNYYDSALRLIRCCEHVAALLATKATPTEALGMKRWLLWIARRVAEASGDRLLGLGRKLSDVEVQALTQIAVALQLPPQ